VSIGLFCGCQKELKIDPDIEVHGNTYTILLKTVAKNVYGDGQVITTNYQYNGNKDVSEITRTFSSLSGTSETQKDKYFRSASGRLDSITFVKTNSPQSSPFHVVNKTEFYYNNTGNIIYSLNKTASPSYPNDSVVYVYQAGKLSKRIVYRFPKGATNYTATATFTYTFNIDGNLSAMDVVWSNPATNNKNCTFTYDNKPNPLPVMEYENELYGGWLKGFDNNFTTPNNVLSRRTSQYWDWDWGNKDYEYRFSSNNKPIYQKVKNADGAGFYEMKYYYD
jgi:hypothetical protein